MKYYFLILLFLTACYQTKYRNVETSRDTVFVNKTIEVIKKADTVALPIRITKFVKDTIINFKFDTIIRYRESQARIKFDFADTSETGIFNIMGLGNDSVRAEVQIPIIRESSVNEVKQAPDFLGRIENFFYLLIGFVFLFMLFKSIK